VLASSVSGTPLFTHIRYMMKTTIPTFCISLVIFAVAGLLMEVPGSSEVGFLRQLDGTFMISPWLLLVPVLTGVMIARRWPAMVVLFLASIMAAIVAVIWQPELIRQIAGGSWYEGIMRVVYGSTQIETGVDTLDKLVQTSGMAGMMPTIWLIICAQIFGGVVTATGVLRDVMEILLRLVRGTTSLIASTVLTGIFCNIAMADQFLSIILTSSMFKDVYHERGFESRLLSRTCEDGATVTSVLVPWNTCGLVQSTVLGVATVAYLPYCFFNLLSPITSVVVAATGRLPRAKTE
jgi:NhaC family Na+:H+ antiporter